MLTMVGPQSRTRNCSFSQRRRSLTDVRHLKRAPYRRNTHFVRNSLSYTKKRALTHQHTYASHKSYWYSHASSHVLSLSILPRCQRKRRSIYVAEGCWSLIDAWQVSVPLCVFIRWHDGLIPNRRQSWFDGENSCCSFVSRHHEIVWRVFSLVLLGKLPFR